MQESYIKMQENYLKTQENYQQVMMSKMALEVKENPDKHAFLKQQLYSVIYTTQNNQNFQDDNLDSGIPLK